MKSVSSALLCVALVAGTAALQAGDSPWPMFRHDLHHTGRTPYTGPAIPQLRWTFTANDAITSSPSLGEEGTIYVGAGGYYGGGGDSTLYALNPDGSLKWQFKTGGGIFSAPAIGPDGTIYFSSLDHLLYAVEDSLTYGKLQWKTDLGYWLYSSPALGPDGTIYLGSLNFRIYAVDPTGLIKWSYPTNWCVFSSPAIGPTGEVYVGSKDEHLYVLEDSVTYGKLRWRFATGNFYDGHLVDSSPAIGPDGTIYVGSYDSCLYAIEDSGSYGALKWKFRTGGWVDGSPTVDGCGTIYFGSRDSIIYALNPGGSVRWTFPAGGEIESSPSIDGQGILYIGTFAGQLIALGGGGPDVGVVAVDLPTEVKAGSTYTPSALVGNYRAAAQSFAVSCLIDTAGHYLYGDTVHVSQLAGGIDERKYFSPWSVSSDTGVVYRVTVVTILNGDANWYNDTLSTTTKAVAEPVGFPPIGQGGRPCRFSLGQSYPNPFNAQTSIPFSIEPGNGQGEVMVGLRIYDLLGREVRRLVDAPLSAGSHMVRWDGRDSSGGEVGSGIYFYRLMVGRFLATRKMVLLR